MATVDSLACNCAATFSNLVPLSFAALGERGVSRRFGNTAAINTLGCHWLEDQQADLHRESGNWSSSLTNACSAQQFVHLLCEFSTYQSQRCSTRVECTLVVHPLACAFLRLGDSTALPARAGFHSERVGCLLPGILACMCNAGRGSWKAACKDPRPDSLPVFAIFPLPHPVVVAASYAVKHELRKGIRFLRPELARTQQDGSAL